MPVKYTEACDCFEEFGTRAESYDIESGITSSVTLRCAWGDRFTLINDIVGNMRRDPHYTAGLIPRARSAAVRFAGEAAQTHSDGQLLIPSFALVTVNYAHKITVSGEISQPNNPENWTLFSHSLEPAAEYLTVDHKRLRWGAANGDALLESEAPGMLLRSLNLVVTLFRRPSIPALAIEGVGHCNNATYVSSVLGLTFPEETLLFASPSLQRSVATNGSEGWTITAKFQYKPNGWNKFWRQKANGGAGGWAEIFDVDGNKYKPVPPVSFASILI